MRIFQIQAKDSVARINDQSSLNCLQSLQWDAALNETRLTEIGNANYDGQTIQPSANGSFEVRTTGATSTFLSQMIYEFDEDGEFTGPMATSNAALIRETDLQFAVFDLINAKKANEIFDRSVIIPRCALSQLSLTANVDGTATETYSFDSDLLEVFRKPQHDLLSVPVIRDATTPTSKVTVPLAYAVDTDGSDTDADWTIHSLYIDNKRVAAADLTVTAGAVRGTDEDTVALSGAQITAGVSIPLGARTHLIIFKKTPGTFPVISHPTTARHVKADQIDLWLIDPTAQFTVGANVNKTVEELLALDVDFNSIPFAQSELVNLAQSFEVSVPLNRNEIKEIKKNDTGTPVVFRSAQFPLAITGTLTINETDYALWAKLQGKNATDVLNLADFENQTWMLVRRDYKNGVALQTMGVLDVTVSSLNSSVSVGGSPATENYSFTGSKFAIQGKTGV